MLGAGFYNSFLALSQVPQELAGWIVGLGLSPWTVLVIILAFYLVFGCLMDSLSMILLTIPIFFPIISVLDFGMSPEHVAIWFGILVLIVVEVGLITPPVGLNLFIMQAVGKSTLGEVSRGVIPFIVMMLTTVFVLYFWPGLAMDLVRIL